jgi:ferredoxin-NADP reductase
VILDKVLLKNRQAQYAVLRQAKLLPRDVLNLTFDVPSGFVYQAGQYVLLGWRNEWHPFTLTSAPEERKLSLHIRSSPSLDWCSALRRRLLVEAPAGGAAVAMAAARPGAAGEGATAKPPAERTSVEYENQRCSHSMVLYNKPKPVGSDTTGGGRGAPRKADTPDLERAVSDGSLTEPKALPEDAVVLQLSGPFGAPAQKVWQFETIMAVGAGIGVTPFASILRSVQIRAKQRQVIQGATGYGRDRQLLRSARGEVDDLLQNIVTVPQRIYFFWIVRNQEELDWFSDLLAASMDGPVRENINVSVFVTGEVELAKVKKLAFVQHQFFGRPDWGRIFKQKKEEHKGEHIGVFLCGSPAVGKELSKASAKHTDPPGQPESTRFSFFKEHF